MTTASIKPLVAKLLVTDDLDAILVRWDAEGLSPGAMSRKIRVLTDYPVHRDTVNRWLKEARTQAAAKDQARLSAVTDG
jgi:hypothetical protein